MTGRLRKWVQEAGWGVIYSYPDGSDGINKPVKHFLHISKVRSEDVAKLALGVKLSFIHANPRSASDLPTALDVQVLPEREITGGLDMLTNCLTKAGAEQKESVEAE